MAAEVATVGRTLLAIRWAARAWALATIVLVIAFAIGEGVHLRTTPGWLGLLLYPCGVCVGLALAWWKEGLGGAISVAGLAAFYLAHFAATGHFPQGWAWLVMAAPGFLFLWCWRLAWSAGREDSE